MCELRNKYALLTGVCFQSLKNSLEIIEVFQRNGIEIPSTDKKVLKLAFDLLNSKGLDIEVEDMLENYEQVQGLEFVKRTKGKFIVALEDKTYLQCCVRVKEKKL